MRWALLVFALAAMLAVTMVVAQPAQPLTGVPPWRRQSKSKLKPRPKPKPKRPTNVPVGPGGVAPQYRKTTPTTDLVPVAPLPKPQPKPQAKPKPFVPSAPIGPGGVAPQYRKPTLQAGAPTVGAGAADLGAPSGANAEFATAGDLLQTPFSAVPYDASKLNQWTPPVKCTEPLKSVDGLVLHPQRQRTLDIARAYIGKMGDYKGKRYGSQLFLDIYNTAYNSDMTDKRWGSFAASIKALNKKPNSWCGIFAVAMNRKGGLRNAQWARWDEKPASQPVRMASKATAGNRGFAPGDILIIRDRDPMRPLNHHCICESVDANTNTVVTIDGNSWNSRAAITNTITRTKRALSDVVMWYKTHPEVWVKSDPKTKPCPYTDLPSAAPADQPQQSPARK